MGGASSSCYQKSASSVGVMMNVISVSGNQTLVKDLMGPSSI